MIGKLILAVALTGPPALARLLWLAAVEEFTAVAGSTAGE
jgi:hypothetical protein